MGVLDTVDTGSALCDIPVVSTGRVDDLESVLGDWELGTQLRLGTSVTVTLECSESDRPKEMKVIRTHPSSQRGQTINSKCSLSFQSS